MGTAARWLPGSLGHHPRALSCVPRSSGSIVARSVSLLASFRSDVSHLQVVSEVTGSWLLSQCHVLFISFFTKGKEENYEPLLAAIQFPQVLAFFEEHATACGKVFRKQKGNSIVAHFQWTARRGETWCFSCGNRLALGKLSEALSVARFSLAGGWTPLLLAITDNCPSRAARKGEHCRTVSPHTMCCRPNKGAVCRMK